MLKNKVIHLLIYIPHTNYTFLVVQINSVTDVAKKNGEYQGLGSLSVTLS